MKAKAATAFFLFLFLYRSLESRKHMKAADEKQILVDIVATECAFESGFYTLREPIQLNSFILCVIQ